MVNLSPTEESYFESLSSLRLAKQVNQCELGKPKKQLRDAKDSSAASVSATASSAASQSSSTPSKTPQAVMSASMSSLSVALNTTPNIPLSASLGSKKVPLSSSTSTGNVAKKANTLKK